MRTALVLAAVLTVALARGDEAWIRGPGGQWKAVRADSHGGSVAVSVPPVDTDAGRTILVVRKPSWMVLEDTAPPVLRSLAANGTPVAVGERIEVRTTGKGPVLRAVVEDAANPLLPVSLVARVGERSAPAVVGTPGTPSRRVEASFDLSDVGPGVYEGELRAADMAPAGNLLRVPLRLTVDGVRRHPDGQTVTVCAGGHEYVVGGESAGQRFVRLGATGAAAFLTTQVNGKFVYARRITRVEDLPSGARLTADVIGIEDRDFGQIAQLEFDLTTDPDVPGLLVTSRSRNLEVDGTLYCFWGWLPGSRYVTPSGDHEWKQVYGTIGKVGWVFLPPVQVGAPGIGLVSALPFGESRFGTMLLYTDPTNIPTKRGEAVEMKLAFMLADGPAAVAAACEKLKAKGWLP